MGWIKRWFSTSWIKEQDSQHLVLHKFERIWNEDIVIDKLSQNIVTGRKYIYFGKKGVIPFKDVIGVDIFSGRTVQSMQDFWERQMQPLSDSSGLYLCISYKGKKYTKTFIVAAGKMEELSILRETISKYIGNKR